MKRGAFNFVRFSNTSNQKNDIQGLISSDIETRFKESLNYIMGDKREGEEFTNIVLLAMAYFFSEIFKHPIKNEYYTIEYVKGFLDADNKTAYTEIHNVLKPFYNLTNAPLFNECWLIIQTAWFVNSEYFGEHQLIEYLNYYIETGKQLPIKNYQYDVEYLSKKYSDYDKGIFNGNTSTFVYGWFNSILFLVCCELNLPLNGFIVTTSGDREYNPLTKCLRVLRSHMPFKVIENDIKSAFVSFLDIEIGARLRDFVYETLMKSKNISRSAAKKLFNTYCNSGLKDYMTLETLEAFFYACGYSETQTKRIIQIVTDKEWTFYQAMTEYERQAVDNFKRLNALTGTARVHDAIIYIDKGLRPANLQAFSTVLFEHTEMNQHVLTSDYYFDERRLKYAYISSVPSGLSIVHRKEFAKPNVLGMANGFIFYEGYYKYISASFNLNDWKLFGKEKGEIFFLECQKMVSTLEDLTKRHLTSYEIESIVKHIRENSNHIFDKRYLQSLLMTHQKFTIKTKKRNYSFTAHLTFKKNSQFTKALNEARRIVSTLRNYRAIYDLLCEHVSNHEYSFLADSYSLKGRASNNILPRLIVSRWNLLTTGFIRNTKGTVKNDTFYNTTIKSVNITCPPNTAKLKKQRQRQKNSDYKKQLLIGNIPKAKQLIYIVAKYAGIEPEVDFPKDDTLINELKSEIFYDYKNRNPTIETNSFDECFPLVTEYEIKPLSRDQLVFDADMKYSIFNQYDEAQAMKKGNVFYKEWMHFHKNN